MQRGRVAGWRRVVKHHGVLLYEQNQVPHRSPLLVQLSRGPGAVGVPVRCVEEVVFVKKQAL